MSRITSYLVNESASIKDAMKKIEANQSRSIFICNDKKEVLGIATDGDIRRFLIENSDMDSKISLCMNVDFVYASEGSSREYVLKLLDHRVQVVPIVDKQKKIIDVVTQNDFPIKDESQVVVRAKSPVRISFGGGGTDLTHYFVNNDLGVVMNATIKMYSHASLKKRDDGKIIIFSRDLAQRVELDSLEGLKEYANMKLIYSLLLLINPNFGFELQVYSDFPMGSGLGGSAVVLSAIIGCFNQFRSDPWDRHEAAELAFQAERILMKMQGGWQDQYATVFGGFNFIEFREMENIIHPLKIKKETLLELEGNLILCNSKEAHVSGQIHEKQKEKFQSDKDIQARVHKNKELCFAMKSLLLRGQLDEFGKHLDKAWRLKKTFSDGISNPRLDDIYEGAISSGALGGKILGAGGGGFFLFYVTPENRESVEQSLASKNLEIKPVLFDDDGLQSWTVRTK